MKFIKYSITLSMLAFLGFLLIFGISRDNKVEETPGIILIEELDTDIKKAFNL